MALQTIDATARAARRAENNVCYLLPSFSRARGDRCALAEARPDSLAAFRKLGDRIELEKITWTALEEKVARAAGGLRAMGFAPGDRAMIFVPMSIDLYIAMLGVIWCGGIAVFLDSFARQHQLNACTELVAPKAFIGDALAMQMRHMVPALKGVPLNIVTGRTPVPGATRIAEVVERGERVPLEPVTGATTALVTFTTGSSGAPKGANRTHEFLIAQHTAIDKHIPYEDDAVDLPAFPIFLLNNLAAGIATYMPAVDLARPADNDPEVITSQILDGITHATMSPAMLHRVSSFCVERGVVLPLRRMVTGGAPVTPAMIDAYSKAAPGSELMILYGSTEAEPMCHITGADTLALMREPDFARQEGVCVGESVRDMPIRLVRITRGRLALGPRGWSEWDVRGATPHDPEARAGRGEVGEVLVAGEHVCRDYYRNAEATEQNKIPDGDLVWHRTGDLGRWDEKGRLWMVGRVHNAIVRGERSYFPVKAEIILKDLPFVKHGAFVGVPDAALGERTAACYVPKAPAADGADVGARAAEARRALEAGGFAVDAVHALEKIPMDPRHHSKVDYDELRKQLIASGVEKGQA
jgi:acyl-CoA synthetase (AMP-forming)/AMP-acid ligase II